MKNGLIKSSRKDLSIIATFIEEATVCMITTVDHNGGLSSRPMLVEELDEEGNLWLFTLANSLLMEEIRKIPVVNLTFTSGKNKFLSARAIGYEDFDKEKLTELWDPSLKRWFKEGLATPEITLLKLDMQEVEYWVTPDSSEFRVINFLRSITDVDLESTEIYKKVDMTQ